MAQAAVKEQIWRELEGLSESKITEVLEFVRAIKAEEKAPQEGKKILELLGFWPDMPDDFVRDIMTSRKSFFTSREESGEETRP